MDSRLKRKQKSREVMLAQHEGNSVKGFGGGEGRFLGWNDIRLWRLGSGSCAFAQSSYGSYLGLD